MFKRISTKKYTIKIKIKNEQANVYREIGGFFSATGFYVYFFGGSHERLTTCKVKALGCLFVLPKTIATKIVAKYFRVIKLVSL